MGWTRETSARDATGQKVRSTAPQATAWCVVGAVDRALYELLHLDVYDLLGLEVDAYDTAPWCQRLASIRRMTIGSFYLVPPRIVGSIAFIWLATSLSWAARAL